jgi:phage/plasmid-like protein (TIGR03299 family)
MTATMETAMHARHVPWYSIGKTVEGAPTSEEAIREAGLDWTVSLQPVYCSGMKADGRFGVIRKRIDPETHAIRKNLLGIVSGSYHPVQNREAFDFFDSLIGTEAHYESAGSLNAGKRVFLTAKMERTWTVADDEIETYLILSNAHDGYHALRAAVTPVRVVCQNTIAAAFRRARRSWSMTHNKDIFEKLREARHTRGLTAAYMDEFVEFGNRAADQKVSPAALETLVDDLFKPVKDTESSRKTSDRHKTAFELCLRQPDLTAYQGTAWGILNAVSDYETHTPRPHAVMRKLVDERLPLFNRAYDFLIQAD